MYSLLSSRETLAADIFGAISPDGTNVLFKTLCGYKGNWNRWQRVEVPWPSPGHSIVKRKHGLGAPWWVRQLVWGRRAAMVGEEPGRSWSWGAKLPCPSWWDLELFSLLYVVDSLNVDEVAENSPGSCQGNRGVYLGYLSAPLKTNPQIQGRREEQHWRIGSGVLAHQRDCTMEQKHENDPILSLEFSSAALGMTVYSGSVSFCFIEYFFLCFSQ